MGKIHEEQESYSREMGLNQRIEYDVSNNAIYVGRSFPGFAETDLKWQIYKMTYDASSNMTALNWADGSDDFKFAWGSRGTYTY